MIALKVVKAGLKKISKGVSIPRAVLGQVDPDWTLQQRTVKG